MSKDLEPTDRLEIQPAELGELFMAVMTGSVSTRVAVDEGNWTQVHETAYQENIAALVGAARHRGLAVVTLIAIKSDGRRVTREISVDKINKDRVLQQSAPGSRGRDAWGISQKSKSADRKR